MNTLFPMTRVLNAAMNTAELDQFSWGRSPKADVLEGEKEFRITMDLPGVSLENLEINLEHQTLNVKASREIEVPDGFERVRHERQANTEFHRTFNLGNAVDEAKIGASFENGVLVISLPKSEQSMPRRIEVK